MKHRISVRAKDYNAANNSEFKVREIEPSELKSITTNNNYSLITWRGNTRKAENFLSASGCVIDVDNGLTIQKAQERLKKKALNHFIVTSKSHTQEAHRYHILVFFNYPVYCSSTYENIIEKVTEIFPEADKSVMDPARFLFGSPEGCEIHEYWNGENYDVTDYEGLWDQGTELLNKDEEKVELSETMDKTPIFCPFHEDSSPSAFVAFSGDNYFIRCSACDQTFWMFQNREEWLKKLTSMYYAMETSLYTFKISNEKFSYKKIRKEDMLIKLGVKHSDKKDLVYEHIVNNKYIYNLNQVDHMGDIEAVNSYYEVDVDEGIAKVHYKAIEPVIQDNKYIENYLGDRFKEYKDFIKQWLAVYCYTNYEKLPTLIFNGDRSGGKSTFAEIVGEIYPTLSTKWNGLESSFNYEREKKFLIIEENEANKLSQYKTLKNYSGAKDLPVNKKFADPYDTLNNTNVCILSNEIIPVFVRTSEMPTDTKKNQFFVYEFPDLTGDIDTKFQDKILERLGHYLRTELKTVFNSLKLENNRYNIDVPITEHEKALFVNNKTEAEHEIDELVSKMTDVINSPGTFNNYSKFFKKGYLPSVWLRDRTKRPEKTIKALIKFGYISGNSEKRQVDSKREYCYNITAKLSNLLKVDKK